MIPIIARFWHLIERRSLNCRIASVMVLSLHFKVPGPIFYICAQTKTWLNGKHIVATQNIRINKTSNFVNNVLLSFSYKASIWVGIWSGAEDMKVSNTVCFSCFIVYHVHICQSILISKPLQWIHSSAATFLHFSQEKRCLNVIVQKKISLPMEK